jgi:hypothetical protein
MSANPLTHRQLGDAIKQLFHFVLNTDNKAQKDDVQKFLLPVIQDFDRSRDEKENRKTIRTILSTCVRAEWLAESTYWQVTPHGIKALETFGDPLTLTREMLLQAQIRGTAPKNKRARCRIFWILFFFLGMHALCLLLGTIPPVKVTAYQVHIPLFICTVLLYGISLLARRFRNRLILLSTFFGLQAIFLGGTSFACIMFSLTIYTAWLPVMLGVLLTAQVGCWLICIFQPKAAETIFTVINKNPPPAIIILALFILLFGGRYGRGGMIRGIWGQDVALVSLSIAIGIFICLAIFYITGGWFSSLRTIGYYDRD